MPVGFTPLRSPEDVVAVKGTTMEVDACDAELAPTPQELGLVVPVTTRLIVRVEVALFVACACAEKLIKPIIAKQAPSLTFFVFRANVD